MKKILPHSRTRLVATQLAAGIKTIIYTALFLVAVSWSSERRVDDVVVSPSPSENPSDEIRKLQAEVDTAHERGVNLLSPTWFMSADKSLQAAKKIQGDGGDYRQL